MRGLLQFYAANRGRGQGLAVQAAAGEPGLIEVYDVIVSSDADAAWMGGASAESFVKAVRGFAGDELHVRVNSPGGDVFAGVAMAQALRESPARVVVHVDGWAASAASLLVAAADEAVVSPGGMVMIHKAWTIALGNADDFMKEAAVLEKIDGQLAETYQRKAGGDVADWLAAMTAETWYTGAEAVAAGLADRVAEAKPAKALARFDASAFANAPQLPAEAVDVGAAAAQIAAVAAEEIEIDRRRRAARALVAVTNC
jgi:ATP-dependent Clp protease, protease subunit